MTKFKQGDLVRVVSIVPDHPSADWHRANMTLTKIHQIVRVVSPDEKSYLLNLTGAPFDFDIFWESQLELVNNAP